MTALVTERPTSMQFDKDGCRPQRIVIVDDSELVQMGLESALRKEPWVSQCFTTGTLEMAQQIVRRKNPHLVMVNTAVNGHSGLKFCRALAEKFPLTKIVLMSSSGKVSMSLATAYGASGFIPQQLPATTIVAVLNRVANGAKAFPREDGGEFSLSLSPREMDVLRHLVDGLSNPEVAAALNLSRHTVKQHTSVVYRKLGVRNRVQAAARAQELGLVA